jgi:tRNA (guanine-N7-)-methyltransferase
MAVDGTARLANGGRETGAVADDVPVVPAPARAVRTTRRRGRSSAWKEQVLREAGPRWLLAPGEPLPTGAPLLVDIGVGDGTATRAWARQHPDAVVVAVELHRPGLAKLVAALDESGPANVGVLDGDALDLLAALGPGSLRAVRVLFPDPWPKRRHVQRRLVDRAFATRVADVLEREGTLEVATDWDDYAEQVRVAVAAEPRLRPDHPRHRPDRPVTAYERRGLAAGRSITDLRYRRVDDQG